MFAFVLVLSLEHEILSIFFTYILHYISTNRHIHLIICRICLIHTVLYLDSVSQFEQIKVFFFSVVIQFEPNFGVSFKTMFIVKLPNQELAGFFFIWLEKPNY